ncbi:endoribonuclease L-PSP [Dactylonectria estremocensis]|uniref:Endoribonuclease L-PSP n=1 Tax=Dactylonectria estremocensis TaxID=1079267 RepID=A0A9P9DN03_9HYPO|nr:endoribonuclease L-PSP [Dactylonectria estremocensis]
MSNLKYFSYDGFGKFALENYGYNQAVRVGDRIEISGQGGWDPDSAPAVLAGDLKAQIDQAFSNIDHAMKSAGGKGMSQVFRITSYHPNLSSEALGSVKENLEKWFPDHKPIWTAVGVEKLAFEEMLVEIEAVAYDPQGA